MRLAPDEPHLDGVQRAFIARELARCPRCRAAWFHERELSARLAAVPAAELPPGLRRRLLEVPRQVELQNRHGTALASQQRIVIVAAAAFVLLLWYSLIALPTWSTRRDPYGDRPMLATPAQQALSTVPATLVPRRLEGPAPSPTEVPGQIAHRSDVGSQRPGFTTPSRGPTSLAKPAARVGVVGAPLDREQLAVPPDQPAGSSPNADIIAGSPTREDTGRRSDPRRGGAGDPASAATTAPPEACVAVLVTLFVDAPRQTDGECDGCGNGERGFEDEAMADLGLVIPRGRIGILDQAESEDYRALAEISLPEDTPADSEHIIDVCGVLRPPLFAVIYGDIGGLSTCGERALHEVDADGRVIIPLAPECPAEITTPTSAPPTIEPTAVPSAERPTAEPEGPSNAPTTDPRGSSATHTPPPPTSTPSAAGR